MYVSSNDSTLDYEAEDIERLDFSKLVLLDSAIESKFDSLWENIVPKLLLFEENECWLPKILSDLIMYRK
jgi:hypothetical protein